jgi:DNA-binding SARP family transcriptional activator
VTEVNTPRLQALLAYLLLHREAPQSRSHVAFQFWPDSTESQALSNLRTLLLRLRRALPDADRFLEATAQTLQWRLGAPFSLDVADFEDSLARAKGAEQAGDGAAVREALTDVVALYGGDLLPSCYEDWILPHRERLGQAYLRALEGLIELLEGQREYEGAVRYAQRLLRHDPLYEAAYRRLMRLRALSGDRAGALRVYHTCAATLARELGVEPSQATQSAYEQLVSARARTVPSPRAVPGVLPLVGREREWAQMQAAWHRSSRGPRFLLLLGEAGIGKTRLVEELLDWAGRQGLAHASTRCYAAEGELAYAPVTVLLRARPLPPLDDVWLTEVARLVPEVLVEQPDLAAPRPMTEAWQRTRLFEALAQAVLGEGQPLLLVLDDLQWCDRETLQWLHYLLRFDSKARLLVVGTSRPEELGEDCPFASTLPDLHRDVPLTEIELGPLDEAETVALAANVADQHLDPALAQHLYRETEGNPLFVVETVQAGLEVGEQPLPPRAQAVLKRRLAQLSPPGRELAELAATIGRHFTFPVLQAAGDGDEDVLVRGLDELWRRRFVRERGADAYDFAHDKLREAAYGTLSPARRRFLHHRVAQALESVHSADLDPVSRQVASHYRQAGLAERAIPYYLRAGQVASRLYANGEAEACFRRGLALLAEGAWDREMAARLYEGLGYALRASQPEEARLAYERALQEADPDDPLALARLQRLIGITWYLQGQFDQSLQAAEVAEGLLGAEPAGQVDAWWREWLDMQLWRGSAYYTLGRWRELAEMLPRVQPAVERHGGPYERAWVYRGRTVVALRRDRYVISDDILADQHTSLSEIRNTGDLWFVAMDEYMLGWLLLLRGEYDEAEGHLRDALALSERIEYPLVRAYALTWLNVLYRKRGQVEKAEANAARALEVGRAARMPEQVAMAQANLAWIAWRKGDLAEAEAQGLAALDSWQRGQFVYAFHWTARWPLLAIALTQDRIPEALDHARAMLDPQQQRLPEALEAALEGALQAAEDGQPEAAQAGPARVHLQRAVALAQETGYL